MGLWLEIVTLLIPGFNDSNDELRQLTEFVASVSPDIPWHVTAFHADYKMNDQRDTTSEDLLARRGHRPAMRDCATFMPEIFRACVGRCRGHALPALRRDTHPPLRIFHREYHLTPEGRCPRCSCQIPGRWAPEFDGQIASRPFLPHKRSRLFTITSR